MALERTLLIIKPDGYKRGLVGEIIKRLENKGLILCGLKLIKIDNQKASELYAVHKNKHFFNSLVELITSGPIVVSLWEGPNAISVVRKLIGKTFGYEAEPGTIRGDFGISRSYNLVHASDSKEAFLYEYKIFFKEEEILKTTEKPCYWTEEDIQN
jgi:nucleoside-diphosphate kinase